MAVGRSAALKLDWTKLATQLGLKGQTAASLQAFKKRNDDARRKIAVLSEQSQSVDFAYYRSVLKNQAVVDDIEKQFNAFKPQTYDVGRQIKAIEAFEAQAVQSAEQTKSVVDKELSDLQKTLKNIEEARPFSDLTVDEVAAAQPEIDKRTEQLVSKGRWAVPGYKARFWSNCLDQCINTNTPTGEVWRSVRPLNIFFPCSLSVPDLGCITYVFVNSSREWKCNLDSDHMYWDLYTCTAPAIC
ncbi:hypothetical protein J3E72DRAFT_237922 [Bipolaris maydis]|uniref:uncharacterized protein n=1 Tax=Cochliobolus heterostrophus TaxID=5016 RepID=UPI0024D19C65|nr:hypothetical protein J3E73DRAFT_228256 [Bipolaris maydis]KAJ5063395.1 hypothetical protein J3E74DRAFT_264392 [Bipolaris maydis]KAJ6199658.1 hypothetical protein J3E72DRAFT_237922 [Bipolaris maydis]KAJ6205741.1 hypothetical protein PSV09DRAFT_2248796 [Bipolaris maydis]KAJ6272785.1 hypothetical protein PSV08DRAFT_219458 [Bipolaris maydis]